MGRRPAHTGRRPSQIALGLKRSGRSGRPQRTALVARRLARRKPEPPPPAHLHDLVSNVQQLVRIVDDLAVDLDGPLRDQSAKLAVADRKSTRLNSSHVRISYAVFCSK